MIDAITLRMKIRDPPMERRVLNTDFNINPFVNRRRLMTLTVTLGDVGNLTGTTTEYPINPLTSLRDQEGTIVDSFMVSADTSLQL